MDLQAEKDKTERVTGLGSRPREETAKWKQMTTLRFQTGERHQPFLAFLQGLLQCEKSLHSEHPKNAWQDLLVLVKV